MGTSRAVHAVVALGLALCLPIELGGFGYAVYRHLSLTTGRHSDVWGSLILFAVISFVVTVVALVCLIVDSDEQAAFDRSIYLRAAWGRGSE